MKKVDTPKRNSRTIARPETCYELKRATGTQKSVLILVFTKGSEQAKIETGYVVPKMDWNFTKSKFKPGCTIPPGVYFIERIVDYMSSYSDLEKKKTSLKKICALVKKISDAGRLYSADDFVPTNNLKEDSNLKHFPPIRDFFQFTKKWKPPFTYKFIFGRKKSKENYRLLYTTGEWETYSHTLDLCIYSGKKRKFIQLFTRLGVSDWNTKTERFINELDYESRNRVLFEIIIFLDRLQRFYTEHCNDVIKPDLDYIQKKVKELIKAVDEHRNTFNFLAEELYDSIQIIPHTPHLEN